MTTHFFTSTFLDGPMGQTQSMTDEQRGNRTAYLRSMCGSALLPVMLTSAHGGDVALVTDADAGSVVPNVDGLLTDCARLPLVVTHQDCVPVFLTDDRSVVGMLHAGWRGVVAGILPNAILLAAEAFGVPAASLRIHLGPAIRPCHFTVGADVLEQFPSAAQRGGAVDLHAALRMQAENLGVASAAITADERCTVCAENNSSPVFASWRREKAAAKNMISVAVRD